MCKSADNDSQFRQISELPTLLGMNRFAIHRVRDIISRKYIKIAPGNVSPIKNEILSSKFHEYETPYTCHVGSRNNRDCDIEASLLHSVINRFANYYYPHTHTRTHFISQFKHSLSLSSDEFQNGANDPARELVSD